MFFSDSKPDPLMDVLLQRTEPAKTAPILTPDPILGKRRQPGDFATPSTATGKPLEY